MAKVNNQDFRDRNSVSPNTTDQSNFVDGVTRREATHDPANYRDGYWQGRESERHAVENQQARENESAASGLLIGLLLAGLAALGAGAYYLLNNQNREVVPAPVINVPAPDQSPQTTERIIERVVPVPQAPPEVNIPTPNVNISVPNPVAPSPAAPAPAAQSQSSPAPAQPQGSAQDAAPEPAPAQ
jgi:hypothetical protein